jgi:hypothetical protein
MRAPLPSRVTDVQVSLDPVLKKSLVWASGPAALIFFILVFYFDILSNKLFFNIRKLQKKI